MIKAEQKYSCWGNPFKFSRLNPLNWMLLSQLMLFWSLKFRNRILNSEFNNRLCSGNVDTLAWQMGLANQTKLEFQDSTSNELLYTVFLWNYLVQLCQFLWWEVFFVGTRLNIFHLFRPNIILNQFVLNTLCSKAEQMVSDLGKFLRPTIFFRFSGSKTEFANKHIVTLPNWTLKNGPSPVFY